MISEKRGEMHAKNLVVIVLAIVFLLAVTYIVYATACNVQGEVFYVNGSDVIIGTPINCTSDAANTNGTTTTGTGFPPLSQYHNDYRCDMDCGTIGGGSGGDLINVTAFNTTQNIYGINWSQANATTSFANITMNESWPVVDTDGPYINLTSPVNNTKNTTSHWINFSFNVSDDTGVANCSLVINGLVNKTETSITNNGNNNITQFLLNGTYNWSINCTDSNGYQNASAYAFNLTIDYNAYPLVDLSSLTYWNISEDTYNDTISLSDYVSDEEDPDSAINWSCSSNETAVSAVENNLTKILNLTASLGFNGIANITCNATDTGNYSNVSSFLVNVTPVVSCGDNISSSATMIKNIGFSGTASCLNLIGDNLVLDCGSYYINQTGTRGQGIGINLSGRENVTIINCNVTNWNISIFVDPSENITIEDSTISGNDYGIMFEAVNNSLISNNLITDNEADGILLNDSFFNRITGNTITYNVNNSAGGFGGIRIVSSESNNFTSNDVYNNGDAGDYAAGFYLWDSYDNRFVTNNATNNTDGFFLNISDDNTLIDCNAYGSGGGAGYADNKGFYLRDSSGNQIIGSDAFNNLEEGIYLDYSNFTSIINTTASYNGEPGIFIVDSSYVNITNVTAIKPGSFSFVTSSSSDVLYSLWIKDSVDQIGQWDIPSAYLIFEETGDGQVRYLQNTTAMGNANSTNISSNYVLINSTYNKLNHSANITLEGITYSDPYITVDVGDSGSFSLCNSTTDPICYNLSYSGGTYVFNTSHFTTFQIADAPVVDFSSIDPMDLAEDTYNDTINLNNYVSDTDTSDSLINWSCVDNETDVTVTENNVTKILNISSTNNFTGFVNVSCIAYDETGGQDDDEFVVNVTQVNDDPVVDFAGLIANVTEDLYNDTTNLSLYVSDVEDSVSAINWNCYTNESDVSAIEDNTTKYLNITSTNNFTGLANVTCIASDTLGGTGNNTFLANVTPVNDPPVVEFGTYNVNMNTNSYDDSTNLSLYVDDVDDADDVINWSCTNNASTPDFNSTENNATKILNLTIANNYDGDVIVNCTAYDPAGSFSYDTFTVNITGDLPPVVDFAPIDPTQLAEDTYNDTINLSVYVTDNEDNASQINWSCSTNETDVSAAANNATKYLNVSATNNFTGTANVTCIAEDTFGNTNADSFITNVTPVNDLPVVENVTLNSTDSSNRTNGTLTGTFDFVDIDGDSAAANQTKWFKYNVEQTAVENATSLAAGNTSKGEAWIFSVRSYDGTDWSNWVNSSVLTIQDSAVAFNASNQVLNATWPEDTTDTSINLSEHFYDHDGDDIDFVYTDGSGSITISIDNSTGVVTLTPSANFSGIEYVVFNATDGTNWAASNNVTLNVTEVNDIPFVENVTLTSDDSSNRTNGTLTGTFAYADAENNASTRNQTKWFKDSVEQTAEENETSLNADNTSKEESWIFSARTFDGGDWSDFVNSTALTILDAAVELNSSNIVPNVSFAEDTYNDSVNLTEHFFDIDGDALTYTSIAGSNLIISINSATGIVNMSATAHFNGTQNANFTANDGANTADSNTIDVNVTPEDDAPALTAVIPNQSTTPGSNITLDMDNYYTEYDGEDVNYTYSAGPNLTIYVNNVTNVVVIEPVNSSFIGTTWLIMNGTDGTSWTESNNVTITFVEAVVPAVGGHGGTRAPPCADECTAGARRCRGAQIVTCADHDGDGCLEFGDGIICTGEYLCLGGECVKFAPPAACVATWKCGDWTECVAGKQSRVCEDTSKCKAPYSRTEYKDCKVPPKVEKPEVVVPVTVCGDGRCDLLELCFEDCKVKMITIPAVLGLLLLIIFSMLLVSAARSTESEVDKVLALIVQNRFLGANRKFFMKAEPMFEKLRPKLKKDKKSHMRLMQKFREVRMYLAVHNAILHHKIGNLTKSKEIFREAERIAKLLKEKSPYNKQAYEMYARELQTYKDLSNQSVRKSVKRSVKKKVKKGSKKSIKKKVRKSQKKRR